MSRTVTIVLCLVCLVVGFLGGLMYAAVKGPPPGIAERGEPPSPHMTTAAPPSLAADDPALIAIKNQIAATPDDPAPYVKAGNLLFDHGQYEQAAGYYEKAVAKGEDTADVLTDLGVAYRGMGKPEKAVEAFRRAREKDPKHAIAALNLGIVMLHDLGKRDEAIAAWKDYLTLAPDGERAPMIRQVLQKLEEEEKQP